ncbi:MAG: glycosyltransferase family 2 protein [Armatimonadota bacterium]
MKHSPELSVVIPTHNGGDVLHRALEALRAQEAPPDRFEVIVVDDGSTDGSTDGVDRRNGPVDMRLITQDNKGRAAARNRGVGEARGRSVLFLDADIWAKPGLISAHLAHHAEGRNIGVQGPWFPHPDSLVNMYMRARHMIPDILLRRRKGLSPFHVITRNFSIDTAAFWRAGGFDEKFTGYGWEDMELGLRLERDGVSLRYEPKAEAFHFHIQELSEAREKLRQAGEGAVYFWEKHGRSWSLGLFLEILPVLLPLKWFVYRSGVVTAALLPLRRLAERSGVTFLLREIDNFLVWSSYYEGVFAARQRQAPAMEDRR